MNCKYLIYRISAMWPVTSHRLKTTVLNEYSIKSTSNKFSLHHIVMHFSTLIREVSIAVDEDKHWQPISIKTQKTRLEYSALNRTSLLYHISQVSRIIEEKGVKSSWKLEVMNDRLDPFLNRAGITELLLSFTVSRMN